MLGAITTEQIGRPLRHGKRGVGEHGIGWIVAQCLQAQLAQRAGGDRAPLQREGRDAARGASVQSIFHLPG